MACSSGRRPVHHPAGTILLQILEVRYYPPLRLNILLALLALAPAVYFVAAFRRASWLTRTPLQEQLFEWVDWRAEPSNYGSLALRRGE